MSAAATEESTPPDIATTTRARCPAPQERSGSGAVRNGFVTTSLGAVNSQINGRLEAARTASGVARTVIGFASGRNLGGSGLLVQVTGFPDSGECPLGGPFRMLLA